MRATILIPALLLTILPPLSRPLLASAVTPGISPSAASAANEADWADWDAQARMADGDYEGAVQAEQHAQAARKAAEELAAHAPGRNDATNSQSPRREACQPPRLNCE